MRVNNNYLAGWRGCNWESTSLSPINYSDSSIKAADKTRMASYTIDFFHCLFLTYFKQDKVHMGSLCLTYCVRQKRVHFYKCLEREGQNYTCPRLQFWLFRKHTHLAELHFWAYYGAHQHNIWVCTSPTTMDLSSKHAWEVVVLSLYKWKNWNTWRLSYTPQITQEACGWARIKTYISCSLTQFLNHKTVLLGHHLAFLKLCLYLCTVSFVPIMKCTFGSQA